MKDTKAWIDFILDKTGLETLSYVGHSQGTTQMFLAGSLDPTYFKQKVNLFVALAPVGTTASISNPLLKFASDHINLFIDTIVNEMKLYNWFPNFEEGSAAIDAVCALASGLCTSLADFFVDETVDNVPRFEMAVPSTPSGQSYRTFVYYAQAIRTGKFTLYDYGSSANYKIYGTTEAPAVPL